MAYTRGVLSISGAGSKGRGNGRATKEAPPWYHKVPHGTTCILASMCGTTRYWAVHMCLLDSLAPKFKYEEMESAQKPSTPP